MVTPLTSPGASMPGTTMPVLVGVSAEGQLECISMEEMHTVPNHSSIDNSNQELELVLRSVVLEQSSGVLVANGGANLGDNGADRAQEGKDFDMHLCLQYSMEY